MMKKIQFKHVLNPSGFTLLEALIGTFIFTIGILAVYALMTSAVKNNSHAGAVTEAATIAADKMEYLNSLLYGQAYLNDGSETKNGYTVAWDVDGLDTDSHKRITVRVTGGRLGRFGFRNNIVLTTLKGRDL